jgi:hypothetical protein
VFLAGLSAGFSAWTKNAGLIFLASTLFSLFVVAFVYREKKAYLKQIGYFVLGALPIVLIIIFFRTRIAPTIHLLSAMTAHPIQIQDVPTRMSDFTRHFEILKAFQRELRNFGEWPFSMPIMLVFYLLVLGLSINVKFKEEVVLLLTTLSLMLAGCYLVYMIAPSNLTAYSLNRVLTQLWASAIFAYFMVVRTVEEVTTIKGP